MALIWKDRVQQTVSAVASSGTGAFTLSTASSGYQALVAGDDAKTGYFVATEGTAWESFWGTYTSSGTSLARTTRIDSSTGSAITFTTAAIVFLDLTAQAAQMMFTATQGQTPGGRLTLTTAVPVTTANVIDVTTIYYTPYLNNVINLWDGAKWVPTIFAEVSLALGTLSSATPYDVFGFLNAGALNTELLAWTNTTTRATTVTLQDGRYCKNGDKTRLYLGTFCTTATTTTEDSVAKRLVWNMYNRVPRTMFVTDATATWTYSTYTWRQARAQAASQVACVIGIAGSWVKLRAMSHVISDSTTSYVSVAIGDNSTTAPGTNCFVGYYSSLVTSGYIALISSFDATPAVGYNYYPWLEIGSGSSTQTWYGAAADTMQFSRPGIAGTVEA